MSFSTDKVSAMNVLKAYDCDIAAIADRLLTSYSDLYRTVLWLLPNFECSPKLLTDFLSSFDTAAMDTEKIYFDKDETSVSDAKVIANSKYELVTYTVVDRMPERVIMGSSIIEKVEIVGGDPSAQFLGVLDVSAGALVKTLEIGTNGKLIRLVISGCNGIVSTVGTTKAGVPIETVDAFDGGYFGGYTCLDPTALCGVDVTALAANKVTSNSILLNWVTPSESVRTMVHYRINNGQVWVDGLSDNNDGVIGNYATDGTTGFSFKGLQLDTYYDFRVINVCENGISSAGVTITQKTTGLASSSGGGGGGSIIIDGQKQFLATDGQTECTYTELLNATAVAVYIDSVRKWEGGGVDEIQFIPGDGKIIFNTPLSGPPTITDAQKVMIDIFR